MDSRKQSKYKNGDTASILGNRDVVAFREKRESLIREMRRVEAKKLLAEALHHIISVEHSDSDKLGFIYGALMAANDAGFDCGIRVFDDNAGDVELYAVFDLPTGSVAFAVAEHPSSIFYFEPDRVRTTVQRFIDIASKDDPR